MSGRAGLPVTGLRLSAEATRSPRWDTRTVKLLLVEDEDAIAEPLAEGLRREGFAVERVATGAAALEASEPDVVLLDIGLPDTDGLAVCRELRSRSEVPIIMVTAKGEEIDRVVGLEVGADDYIVKPFGFRELIARIRAVTRRTASRAPSSAVERGAARRRPAHQARRRRRERGRPEPEGVRSARAARERPGGRRVAQAHPRGGLADDLVRQLEDDRRARGGVCGGSSAIPRGSRPCAASGFRLHVP